MVETKTMFLVDFENLYPLESSHKKVSESN